MFRYVILSYQRLQTVRVFHQMFLNLVGNIVIIFAFQEADFVSAIKASVSGCGRQGTAWAYEPNLVWGGGEGHSISLPDRFAYAVHIYNFVRDFIRAFFKDFPVGGGGIF